MKRTAVISECGKYRYRLGREWAEGPTCVFIMLNPSTADALKDDHTIRRCMYYAKREGCGTLTVVNLFAYRTKDPKVMKAQEDPIGPENDAHIEACVGGAKIVIAAWGANGGHNGRCSRVRHIVLMEGIPLYALNFTKADMPGHPARLRNDAPLLPYNHAARKSEA